MFVPDPPLLDLYQSAGDPEALSTHFFEDFARSRGILYQYIESFDNCRNQDMLRRLHRKLHELFPLHTLQQQRNDVQSHFAMRIVCGKQEELRRKFEYCETLILEARAMFAGKVWQSKMVAKHIDAKYQKKDCCAEQAAFSKIPIPSIDGTSTPVTNKIPCWVIPFEECTDVVKRRRVIVENGYALVPVTDFLYDDNRHNTKTKSLAAFVMLEGFRKSMAAVAEISSRARALLDTDPNTASCILSKTIQSIEKDIKLPFTSKLMRNWRMSRSTFQNRRCTKSRHTEQSTANQVKIDDGNLLNSKVAIEASAENNEDNAQSSNEEIEDLLQHKAGLEIGPEILRNPNIWRYPDDLIFSQ